MSDKKPIVRQADTSILYISEYHLHDILIAGVENLLSAAIPVDDQPDFGIDEVRIDLSKDHLLDKPEHRTELERIMHELNGILSNVRLLDAQLHDLAEYTCLTEH